MYLPKTQKAWLWRQKSQGQYVIIKARLSTFAGGIEVRNLASVYCHPKSIHPHQGHADLSWLSSSAESEGGWGR